MLGQTIAHYRITEKLGAGGMGEVYRARDERLGRDVAIKVLPEAFAGDAARRARFEREAQLLAALNHPYIAAIYGLEVSGGVHALVMELVEGETVAQRLARGPLPLEDALDVARQIAEAFEAAHDRGIVHRDLKPANVKITPGGAIKVLDFGLAKAFASDAAGDDPSNSPTLTSPATRAGVILGTAAYMSPEQARGKAVDKRADIWSFGAVLYEMLAGKQCFGGETVSDTLAGIIRAEPEWDAIPAQAPAGIRRLLRRCLEKDSKRRLRDIGEARIAIEEALTGTQTAVAAPIAAAALPAPLWRTALPWALAGILAVALAISVVGGSLSQSRVEREVLRLNVAVPPTEPLSVASGPALVLSPDGKYIVYVVRRGAETRRGETQLFLRRMDEFEAKAIPGTENGVMPFFSPDGQWIGFFADNVLKKVAVGGGPVLTVCPAEAPFGGSWGPDAIIFASRWAGESLVRVSPDGGEPTVITRPDSKKGENSHRWPEILPGGRAVVFTIGAGSSFNDARIALLDLKTGEWRTLIEGGSNPRYAPNGHLIFARQETLLAAPFDLDRLTVTGPPVPLLAGLTTNPGSGEAQFSLSAQGTLAYLSGGSALALRALVRVERKGTARALGETLRPYEDLTLSPDGRRVAVTVEGAAWNVWVYDIERGTLTRLTTQETNTDPLFTPDGKRIIYTSLRSGKFGLYWKPADGSGPEEQLTSSEHFQHAYSISRDGRLLAFSERVPGAGGDLWVLPLAGDPSSGSAGALGAGRKPQPFLRTPFNEWFADFSPDGRWIAYTADESGRGEIYVQPYPGPGGRVQISVDGGSHSRWAPNGRELFYRNGDKLMVVNVVTQPTFIAGNPRVLFSGDFWSAGHDYDVSPDGQSFVFIKSNEKESGATQINFVLNWFDELKHRVPAGKK